MEKKITTNITQYVNETLAQNNERLDNKVTVYNEIFNFTGSYTVNIEGLYENIPFKTLDNVITFLYNIGLIEKQLLESYNVHTVVYYNTQVENPTIKTQSFTCNYKMTNFIDSLIFNKDIEIISAYTTNTETLETENFTPTKDLT